MSNDDQAQIRKLLDQYEGTLNHSDADTAASLYHPDGVFMPMGFPSSSGSDDIRAAYTGIFSTIQLNISFEIEEVEIDGDTAFATTSSAGTVKVLAEGIEVPEANRELFVFRKLNGSWKIYRYMFNKTSAPTN